MINFHMIEFTVADKEPTDIKHLQRQCPKEDTLSFLRLQSQRQTLNLIMRKHKTSPTWRTFCKIMPGFFKNINVLKDKKRKKKKGWDTSPDERWLKRRDNHVGYVSRTRTCTREKLLQRPLLGQPTVSEHTLLHSTYR